MFSNARVQCFMCVHVLQWKSTYYVAVAKKILSYLAPFADGIITCILSHPPNERKGRPLCIVLVRRVISLYAAPWQIMARVSMPGMWWEREGEGERERVCVCVCVCVHLRMSVIGSPFEAAWLFIHSFWSTLFSWDLFLNIVFYIHIYGLVLSEWKHAPSCCRHAKSKASLWAALDVSPQNERG